MQLRNDPYSSTYNKGRLPDFTLQAYQIKVKYPHCHCSGMTKVEAKIGMLQWLFLLILCILG